MATLPYLTKLKRLKRQLVLNESKWNAPSLIVLQSAMHALRIQTDGKLEGPLARLFLSFRFAFQAQETEKSKTGFIGPVLAQCLEGTSQLMQFSLSSAEKENGPILKPLTETMAIASLMASAYLMEKGKKMVPQEDLEASQRAVYLYHELGMLFLLGARAPDSVFSSFAQALNFSKENKQRVADIGMSFMLSLLLLSEEGESSKEEEYIEMIFHFLKPHLLPLEQALTQAQMEGVVEQKLASAVLFQLRTINESRERLSGVTIRKAFEKSFEAFSISNTDVIRDIKVLKRFCTQLIENFNSIFYQTKMAATTIIQAA